MGPPWQFALNKTPPARPNLGFTICHLSLFPLGFREPEGHLYFNPRASAPLSVGPTCQLPVATRGNSGLAYRKFRQSECALRKRYVQLLSGFVGTFGRLCWSCFTIVEMSCKPGFRDWSGLPGRRSIPSLIARACHGLSWDTPAGYKLSRAVPAVMWQMGIC